MTKILFSIFSSFLLPVLCTAQTNTLEPADYSYSLEVDGLTRSYLVHMPPAKGLAALPVVLNFHGGGGNASQQKEATGMDLTADRNGFIAVYPSGSGKLATKLLTWNAGCCCGGASKNKVDDVGFVVALLKDLEKKTAIDRSRVYATGFSNGAMMSYRLGIEAQTVIAAIATVSGGPVLDPMHLARPMPLLHIHSVDDPRALYQGGLGPGFPFTNHRVNHPNIESALTSWAKLNGCTARSQVVRRVDGSAETESSGHTATLYRYSGCDSAPVVYWKLTGAGHVWPGAKRHLREFIVGEQTAIIDANQEVWNFLSEFRLPPNGS